jgi:hypothetical protein
MNFGPLQHNRRDLLPFCQIAPDSYVVGTSFGELRHLTSFREGVTSRRVGKRIATQLVRAGPVLVCGTDSGEVIGLNITGDG